MNTSTQKAIKVGDSIAVTIPAKDAKAQGISVGDEVRISFERVTPKSDDVLQDYAKFQAQYGDTLKHLADK